MSVRDSLVRSIGKLSVLFGKACGPFYLTAISLSVYEVFTRYALNAPTVWTTEAIMCAVGAAWILSAAPVTQQRRHITVTVMEMLVGPKIWSVMAHISLLISMLAVTGLIIATVGPAVHAIENMERSGSAFNPPLPTLFKSLIVFASSLYLLQLFARLIEKQKPDETSKDSQPGEGELL